MDRSTQRDKVLQALQSANGAWVPLTRFVFDFGITRMSARVFEIRKSGITVESREERKGTSRHVFYRIPVEGQ